jgi:hypothetical protein
MEKKVSATSTKNEILEAYNEALAQLQKSKTEAPKVVKEQEEKKAVVKAASENTESSLVKNIAELKLTINSALDKVADALVAEQKKLSQITEAINIEQIRLEDLYQINAGADSLATLLLVQKQKKEQFEAEIDDKQQKASEEILAKKTAFETELNEKKAKWTKEQQEHDLAVKERDTLLQKERKREEEEYAYNIKTTRKKEQDIYLQLKESQENQLADQKFLAEKQVAELKAAAEKEVTEKRKAFEKEIAEREQVVSAREAEFAELKKKAETFPVELQKAVTQAEKTVAEKLQTTYKFESQLKDKEFEGELKLREQTIITLQLRIKDLETLNKQLTQKVDGSEINVKEIAIKAIESSSNIRLFEKEKSTKEEKL